MRNTPFILAAVLAGSLAGGPAVAQQRLKDVGYVTEEAVFLTRKLPRLFMKSLKSAAIFRHGRFGGWRI